MSKEMGWRGHRSRLALGTLAAAAATGAAVYVFLPLAVRGLIALLGIFFRAVVWLASALSSGADAWTIAGIIGRVIANVFMSTEILVVMAVLVLVSALALYGLQRLLGFEEESSQ